MDNRMLTFVKRWSLFLTSVWLIAFATNSVGETFVQATVESRVMLAFHANAGAIQHLIPSPWQLNTVAKGPMQGTNFFVVLGDRAIDQDPDGKPRAGGVSRFTAFAAPATNPDTGRSGIFVFRIFTVNSEEIPGPYKCNVLSDISRKYFYSGGNMEFGIGEEKWIVDAKSQADIELTFRYQKSLPFRPDRELNIYSAVEPTFYRIYRVDQGTDIVMSKPKNIDRLLGYEARINVPEFKSVLDGTEELISVAVLPWYVRKVFLP